MSDDFKVQVSVRTPAGSLINARGDSVAEVQAQLAALQGIAGDIATTEALLLGAGAAAPLAVPAAVAPAAVTTPAPAGGGQPPAYNPPAPAANTPPSCPHGPRKWFSSPAGSADPWGGWFCPLPKGSPNKCKTEYDRSYGK